MIARSNTVPTMRFTHIANFLSPSFSPVLLACMLSWIGPKSAFASTPIATYGTYFGGGREESTRKVVTDFQGNVIVIGTTTSATLPGTANAFQRTKSLGFPNNEDVFIAKFDPTGRALLWATFLGGDDGDVPVALAVDSSGNIYVTGTTQSSNYPAQSVISCVPVSGISNFDSSPPFKQNCSMGPPSQGSTSFVSKISSDGTRLIYSVGISGMGSTALTVNNQGEAYFATIGNKSAGTGPVFLFRLNARGDGLIYGALLGGGSAKIWSLVTDVLGNCYLAGTATANIPTTANGLQISNSNADLNANLGSGFVMEVDASGSQLVYGTWFGSKYAQATIIGLALASDGSLYFTGVTNGTAFSATPGAYLSAPRSVPNFCCEYSGYVAKLRIGATSLDAFSYLPGAPISMKLGADQNLHLIFPQDITYKYASLSTPTLGLVGITSTFAAIDLAPTIAGPVWIAGTTYSTSNLGGLFATNDAFQTALSGASDAFLGQFTWINPIISLIGSSATGAGPFAAGQLVSIYGSQLGPPGGSSLQVGQDGVVTKSNGGTQVLFDGVAAPILYAGLNQVNVAIPCLVARQSSTQVVVTYSGVQSAAVTLPLTAAAPGIFTTDGSGRGQAAVLNQDYSFNGLTNPAARGSAITFFATGIGVTSPCVDGKTYQNEFPRPTLPVVVGVGSSGAQVLYAGQAPLFISGAAQINAVIPSELSIGVVSLSLGVDGVFSPQGVTIAVK